MKICRLYLAARFYSQNNGPETLDSDSDLICCPTELSQKSLQSERSGGQFAASNRLQDSTKN
jgi:hypothetical protein